jgi:polysaccharide export outer membrane protein
VLIFEQPDWQKSRTVVITGEVRSPGTYTLLSKNDRVSDVIARAGGPTRAAYTNGIGFYRRAGRLGRIGVDLPRVLRDASNRDNLILQDGDSLDIPAFTGVVEVQGAVNSPRGVAYVPGKNLMFYIHAAGGESKTGDPEHSYVTQSDGKVESYVYHRLWMNDIPEPAPGSTVFVPEKPIVNSSDALARIGIVAQVIGSLVTIIAVLHK